MKRLVGLALILSSTAVFAADVAPAPNGITLPENYKDWRVIAMTHRVDNDTVRVIIGNDAAIEAARAGETNPWPDGAILGKLVWSQEANPDWEPAIGPGEFRVAEFMVKDSAKYADTGGWGFARWLGVEQRPFGENADFANDCFACHLPVADADYVFTRPIVLP